MADKSGYLNPEQIAKLCKNVFGEDVVRITAPGGKSRDSLRVYLKDRSLIATQRAVKGRFDMECDVLQSLHAHGAPVPAVLAVKDNVLLQQDVGSARFSSAMASASDHVRLDIAASAVESLEKISAAGEASGLLEKVPALGLKTEWIQGFIATAGSFSKVYGVAPPALKMNKLTKILSAPATTFIKWDARPGNATFGDGNEVFWFDWEHCGKRSGVEDFAWLIGDEFWPLPPENSLDVLNKTKAVATSPEQFEHLGVYASLHMVQRLRLIFRRRDKRGWVDPDKAMKYDRIGVDPEIAIRLCAHGEDWSSRFKAVEPMSRWFADMANAVVDE